LEPLVLGYWRLRGEPVDYLRGDRTARFRKIYREGRWTGGDTDTESLSGPGSTIAATSTLRRELPSVLTSLGATSLLDIGCGDFNWMSAVDLPCSYIGVDIVPEVIERNIEDYSRVDRVFFVLDAVADELPSADAAICREVLFHLSLADAKALLRNLRATGARYLLATSDPSVRFNADIPTGAWRDVNLALKPYGLGQPMSVIPDSEGPNPRRVLGIWKL